MIHDSPKEFKRLELNLDKVNTISFKDLGYGSLSERTSLVSARDLNLVPALACLHSIAAYNSNDLYISGYSPHDLALLGLSSTLSLG